MKTLKVVFGSLVIFILLALVISLFLPSKWTVERKVEIQAAAADVFPYINNLRKWPEWTVWYQREPKPQTEYSGPEQGVGARSAWSDPSGSGELTITASEPNAGVEYTMEMNQGEFSSRGAIRLSPSPLGTMVTWTLSGDVGMNPIGRYFVLGIDKMVGPDFENGLANLKRKLEGGRPAAG